MLGSLRHTTLRQQAGAQPQQQSSSSRRQLPGRACPLAAPAPSRRGSAGPHHRRRGDSSVVRSGLEGFLGLSALLKPEIAAVFSAIVAAGSVGLNYYGSLLTESKRVELQKELDREKQAEASLKELASIISRYRGPLLESSVDLEQRIWHLATMTGEWYSAKDVLCGEEIAYTLFTLAQFLGFLEVVRREGPRERSFLAAGNPQGSDTLATLVESFRFVLCASPATLAEWLAEPGDRRDHPGCRSRHAYIPRRGKRKAMTAGMGDGPEAVTIPLRVSRGSQRAIGSQMGATPLGSERHYTHSYSTFLAKLASDPEFAAWLQPIEADLAALLTGTSWMGEPPGPPHRWTRVLLLQQLLVDAIDLLDPDYVRVPFHRRIRLSPITYAPLPNVEQYTAALTLLSGPVSDAARLGGPGDGGQHFKALQNLLHPERVVGAAAQVRRVAAAASASKAAAASNGSGSPGSSSSGSPGSSAAPSPLVTTSEEDGGAGQQQAPPGAPPVLPSFQLLPAVGATGVRLLQQLSGQGQQQQREQEQAQPQLQRPRSPDAAGVSPQAQVPPAGDMGGTAVTAQPPSLAAAAAAAAAKNGKRKSKA